ncbi:MAG: 16S rRNA (guanine(527)-N(7))-methyltransferase RsmG [Candidatus Cyclobacteriaceae bacterium M3_2C_046]
MAEADIIFKYFPDLNQQQKEQMLQLQPLYQHWNQKINLISRKDMDSFYLHHVLHSLSLARFVSFEAGHKVLDVGTGGGFPGIPLAILFPHTRFVLVDSIGKKIKVVNEVAETLKLKNVTAIQDRAEKVKGTYHYVVSRAVTQMRPFYHWVKDKIEQDPHKAFSNGILYLKGGDLEKELNQVKRAYQVIDLKEFFEESFFITKKIVFFPF